MKNFPARRVGKKTRCANSFVLSVNSYSIDVNIGVHRLISNFQPEEHVALTLNYQHLFSQANSILSDQHSRVYILLFFINNNIILTVL